MAERVKESIAKKQRKGKNRRWRKGKAREREIGM